MSEANEQSLEVSCPFCQSKPNEKCREFPKDAEARDIDWFHLSRLIRGARRRA